MLRSLRNRCKIHKLSINTEDGRYNLSRLYLVKVVTSFKMTCYDETSSSRRTSPYNVGANTDLTPNRSLVPIPLVPWDVRVVTSVPTSETKTGSNWNPFRETRRLGLKKWSVHSCSLVFGRSRDRFTGYWLTWPSCKIHTQCCTSRFWK